MADEDTGAEDTGTEDTGAAAGDDADTTAVETSAKEKTTAKTETDEAAPSWTDSLTSDGTKKFAEGSPDLEHAMDRAVKMREQLSKAIIPPGKDADDVEVAAFRKKIGVPEASDGYTIKMPEGTTETEIDTAFHANLAAKFHEMNVPADTAAALNDLVNDHTLALQQMVAKQDEDYAAASAATLKQQWPGAEYDTNLAVANRAMQRVFPDEAYEEFRALENKDGTLTADSPLMLRAFAILGKEFEEGGLAPALSESDRRVVNDQLRDIRGKISEANERGDSKEANRLYQTEQALIAKTQGDTNIVGSRGRAA